MAGPSQLIQIELHRPLRQPKPEWLRTKAPVGDNFHNLKKLARGLGLHTVCESAQCPNIGECWDHHTATFMLLGDICTRRCGFCAVPKGRPQAIDWDEPRRVAEAVATLGLRHAVVTSVNRDDDNVGGARIFAETIRQIREAVPECRVDILTIGQYLRPSKDHLPMTRYYTPAEFVSLKEEALKFGFKHVESGPLVRSSYHAHEQSVVVGR